MPPPPMNRVTFYPALPWLPEPPAPPTRYPTAQTSNAHTYPALERYQATADPLPSVPESPPRGSPDSPTYLAPTTKEGVWDAVKRRTQELCEENKEADFVSIQGKQGVLKHNKIRMRSGQLLAFKRLLENPDVLGHMGFEPNYSWNDENFLSILDKRINTMLSEVEELCTIVMQAKAKPTAQPTAAGNPEAGAGLSTTKAEKKGKGKAKDQGGSTESLPLSSKKRSLEEDDRRTTSTKKQRQEDESEKKKKEQGDRDAEDEKAEDEKAEDEKAQEKVREWYGQVSVPTGHGLSKGAHILSVYSRARYIALMTILDQFWPKETVQRWKDAIENEGRSQNILPMDPTTHTMFDRFEFALRPAQCPDYPTRRIFLQLDLSFAINPKTLKPMNAKPTNHYLSNYRDMDRQPQVPFLSHGDILEIETTGGKENLPSFEILGLVYTLARILGALKGAAVAEAVFGKEPPSVDPVLADEAMRRPLPAFQELMFELALESGFMTRETLPSYRALAVAQLLQEEEEQVQKAIDLGLLSGERLIEEEASEEREMEVDPDVNPEESVQRTPAQETSRLP